MMPLQGRRLKQIARHVGIAPVLEAPYHMVGQLDATNEAIDCVLEQFVYDRDEPMVMLFTGLSGHGKTELAQNIGKLLTSEVLTIDCTSAKNTTDLFGPSRPYFGAGQGSVLNNHLCENSGQRTVVFLDEFDKTSDEVRQTLLLPFDRGTYRDRRNDAKDIDCSRVIWILAGNIGTETISKFWDCDMKDVSGSKGSRDRFTQLQKGLRTDVIGILGEPISGRLSRIVPFLPFNDLEQAVVTFKFMREFKNERRTDIDVGTGRFLGHSFLNYHDDGKIAATLARGDYMQNLGARSLRQSVRRNIESPFRRCATDDGDEITDETNNGPLQNYEVRLIAEEEGDVPEVRIEASGVKKVLRRADDA